MASQKQIEANRLNAQKSTGPRTPAGKARSSMNALKTGIDSQSQIIPGESETHLHELIAQFYDRFHPTTAEQRTLVDTLIDCEWLSRRFRAVETQLWKMALAIYDQCLGQVYTKYNEEFARLQRRIDVNQRNYRHALHELERLLAEEAAPADAPAEPVTPAPRTGKLSSGFVPRSPLESAASGPPDAGSEPSPDTPEPPKNPVHKNF